MPIRQSRSQAHVSEVLETRLNTYVLAASATGLGLLALAQPSPAEVVYVPAHVVIGFGGLHDYNLDLNGDGVTDFVLEANFSQSPSTWRYTLDISPQDQNGVVGRLSYGTASALRLGSVVGPAKDFIYRGALMASWHFGPGSSSARGRWANVRNRYLGLTFQINGEIHYGWARLSVRAERLKITALLTGYAYETEAEKPIYAGATPTPTASRDSMPNGPNRGLASLGVLALGAPGLEVWLRRDPE